MTAALQRRIAKIEKKRDGQYLILIDFLHHLDSGEPLPDRPVDPRLKELLEHDKH